MKPRIEILVDDGYIFIIYNLL